jgi:hypothetical protein
MIPGVVCFYLHMLYWMFPSWWAVMVFGVYKKSEYDCSYPFLIRFSTKSSCYIYFP